MTGVLIRSAARVALVLAVLAAVIASATPAAAKVQTATLGKYATPEGTLIVWTDGRAQFVPVQEDSPRWDCRMHGNGWCGPGNGQGVAPGRYSYRGTLVEPWGPDSPARVLADSGL